MKKSIVIIENNIIATNTIRYKLTNSLIENGYDVTVLTTGTPSELELARSRGFRIVDVKASNMHPKDISRYVFNLTKELKKAKADLCLTFTMRPAIWGNMVTRRLGIPTITNITGIGPLFASNNISYKAARTLYKFVLKKTARVFFQNYDDMNLFLSKNFVSRIQAERIPGSGIDHEYYKPLPKQRTDDKFCFLFISRLIKDKGILEFIEAARILKSKLPEAEFQVLGPYWSQNLKDNIISEMDIANWVKEGIIKYKGAAEDVRGYIAEADCIVLPSYREGTSNVLLEAGSMAKPCITCDVTGCNEIVQHGITGYLCEVRNGRDLAAKMKAMYELPAQMREEMGLEARKHVIQHFDKQIVINAYLKAVNEIIA